METTIVLKSPDNWREGLFYSWFFQIEYHDKREGQTLFHQIHKTFAGALVDFTKEMEANGLGEAFEIKTVLRVFDEKTCYELMAVMKAKQNVELLKL